MIRCYFPSTGEVVGISSPSGYTPFLCTLFGVPFYLYNFHIEVIRSARFEGVYFDEFDDELPLKTGECIWTNFLTEF